MALINCPECGKMISDKAERCPHCGVRPEKPKGRPILGIILVILTAATLVVGQYLLSRSEFFGFYVYDDSNFLPAIILFAVMLICGVSAAIFFRKNKTAGSIMICCTVIALIVPVFQCTVYSKVKSWEAARYIYDERRTNEVLETSPEIATAGWEYIRENVENSYLALTRFQYLDESACSEKDSPLRNLKGASWGFYDIETHYGWEMVWVFFKNGKPRFMCTKDQYSDRDLMLHLIGAWDDRSPEKKAWDNAARQMDHNRIMK